MSATDLLVAILLVIFFAGGWRKGIVRSLIGPVCFFGFAILGVVHYDITNNLVKSLLIVILGTTITTIVLSVGLFFARKTLNEKDRNFVFWLSRVLGSFVNLAWEGLVLMLIVVFLNILPNITFIENIQEDISKSYTYGWANANIISHIPIVKNTKASLEVFNDPAQVGYIQSMPEYETFRSHPKIQALLSDPEISKQIQDKDMAKLLSNPSFTEILKDEDLMVRFSNLSKKVYRMKSGHKQHNRGW